MTAPTRVGVDWDAFAERYWERGPVVLAAAPPVSVGRAFAMAVAASAPFHAGTRFMALPDVRFHTGDGRLRAPAELLPGPDDVTVDGYQDRLDRRLGADGHLLTVEQPLLVDAVAWARVRDTVSGLWQRVGWPNLPLVAELTVGGRRADPTGLDRAPTHAVLTWVLRGELTVRLWPPEHGPVPASGELPGAVTLRADAGRLLYWPAGHRYLDEYPERCVALRLRVPVDPRLATAAAHDLLADVVRAEAGAPTAVPYLPFPPPPHDPVLAATGDAVRRALTGPALATAVRRHWAGCRSAAGLHPPPPPRPAAPLPPRVRVVTEIVPVADGPHRWLWGVNGHVVELAGATGERLLAELRPGREPAVDALCATVGATDDRSRDAVRAVLRTLYRLRAVEPVGEAP